MRLIARSFLLLTLAASLAPTARAGSLVGIDGMTATVMQQKQSSFSGLGVRARLRSAQLLDKIEFMPYVEYWRNTSTVTPFDIRSSRSDATIGGDARYMGSFRGMHPYIGTGFGLHFLNSEVQAPSLGLPFGRNSLVKGGLSLLGGATFPLAGRLENFIEVKYHHVPSYGQLKINMGLAYTLK
ncbi:MAG: hypothetical protein ABIS67_00525 [Candidatus Eisenbacteria bacterium]